MQKLKNLFSTEAKPGAFFRRIDWTAFWGATLVAFLVYFFTLGPSVGLEDSGELATAADHLGVPHPPGYPFWSLCSWIFCRLFSWVTYMGQPTPAWAVSLFSAVAGAFAAGCTAMLICRSGSDMLDSLPAEEGEEGAADDRARRHALMSLAGGLGGSLVFAFSPVEWSQSTIVEIYSLNALFLMAVFLLSYRWMRRPSDRILWLTAFVFGLGLTNYQVLLLAAVPLAIIIFFRNITLFRDFCLILIPIGLTAKVLQIGSLMRADRNMSADVINKFQPLLKTDACPNSVLVWIGCALVAAAPVAGLVARRVTRGDRRKTLAAVAVAGFGGVAALLLSVLFARPETWLKSYEMAAAPLVEPIRYALIGALLAACCVCAVLAAFAPAEDRIGAKRVWVGLAAAGVCALAAFGLANALPSAGADGYAGAPFDWSRPTLLLFAGVAAVFALSAFTPGRRGLAFAIPVAALQLTVFVLLRKGALNGLTDPHSWWFAWPVVWNFVVLGLALVALPNGRSIAPAMFFAEFGVCFYAYMPIVSDLRNPPMNWGYPRTWEGFKHAIMRGQYEAITMPDFFSKSGFALFLKQLGFYFQDLRMQFTLVAAALALVPFALWKVVVRKADGAKPLVLRAAGVAAGLYVAVAGLVIVFSELFENLTGGEAPLRLDKYLLLVLALLALAGLVAMVARQLRVVCAKTLGLFRRGGADAPAARPSSAAPVRLSFLADDVSQQWLLAVGACFAIMSLFLVALANVRGDIQDGFIQKVKFISSHGMFSLWIGYGLAVGLMVASRLLARLLPGRARLRRAVFRALCAAAACVALIPVYENYTNDRLVFAMGSAEQNGHTFGWQFGNYQLRGANAIREELDREEEPLPNPMWPEEMAPGAVFFGGTDPGRFVPTYMIYSANVRPDVYLITQNALADDTYMSVERDLYGNDIWIPAKEDSAESFNIYVNEVQSGKRPANADLKIENGRVQVTGALGVMEINGVLTKMMFDHEKRRRAFYVEESYVIQWMYPYLTPHGLIMKINPEERAMNLSILRNDMEFWDWYQRRLLRDPAFRRDFPAQKSFSKLRAAIAGLYARYSFNPEFAKAADQAFREAVTLYPASPEATFRYIQEVLFTSQRWPAIHDLLDYTDRVDPNNSRTGTMREMVQRFQSAAARLGELQAKAAKAPLSPEENVQLATCAQYVGRRGVALDAAEKALAGPGPVRYATVVRPALDIFLQGGQNQKAVDACKKALASAEADAYEVAADIGFTLMKLGQSDDAARAFQRALAHLPARPPAKDLYDMAAVFLQKGLFAEADRALGEFLRASPSGDQAVVCWLERALVKTALGQAEAAQNAVFMALRLNRQTAVQIINSNGQLRQIAAPILRMPPSAL